MSTSAGLSAILGTSNNTGYYTVRQDATIPAGGRLTVCLPILSGVTGSLADGNLPLGNLASDIRVEFTLKTLVNSVVGSAGTTRWQIQSAEIQAQIIELYDKPQSMEIQQFHQIHQFIYMVVPIYIMLEH